MGLFGKAEPETMELRGKPFRCQACGHDTFYRQRAQLHSPLATLFGVEWTGNGCTCVICAECGYVHWFLWE
jgi:hypothetical protein